MKETFLKELKENLPKSYDLLTKGHTLYINTKLMSEIWYEFENQGVSIRSKDFLTLTLMLNEERVDLSKNLRHYSPFPNKRYKSFGTKDNKEGFIIELSDDLWESIKETGKLKLMLDYSILENSDKKVGFQIEFDDGETGLITHSTLIMDINVKNVEGNHLMLDIGDYGLSNPIAFFEEDKYNDFSKYRTKLFYKKDNSLVAPVSLDLNSDRLLYSFVQKIEIEIEPYDVYLKDNKYSGFYFRKIVSSSNGYKDDFFRPVGRL